MSLGEDGLEVGEGLAKVLIGGKTKEDKGVNVLGLVTWFVRLVGMFSDIVYSIDEIWVFLVNSSVRVVTIDVMCCPAEMCPKVPIAP